MVTGGIANVDGYCIVGQDTDSGNAIPDGLMQMVDAFSRWQVRSCLCALCWFLCLLRGGEYHRGQHYDGAYGIPREQNVTLATPPTHDLADAHGDHVQIENYDYTKSVFIPGCPAHPDWIVLTIVHLLTNGMPPTETDFGRPLTLMGQNIFAETVHQNCPRKLQHDLGNFADHVGDNDKCLIKVGCRGKETYCPCPVQGWNSADIYNSGQACLLQRPGGKPPVHRVHPALFPGCSL